MSLSFYVHIPYCIKRCGYCDFNTYTPSELRSGDLSADISGVSEGYIDRVLKEIDQARSEVNVAIVPTIFFGGGTPTLLEAHDLNRVISKIKSEFEVSKDCEITIEANPDTVTEDLLTKLREGGFNRISFGMQSAVPHVLATLDRTHKPEGVGRSVALANSIGFEHISVDLIYGTPGESIADWEISVNSALSMAIDHISAYALIVEAGTKLSNQVKRGEVIMPADDETAEKYRIADDLFASAGFNWYELSNWAKPGGECRHNINYWNGSNWWGVGPGAHSFLGNERWWNVKHPSVYQERIDSGLSPKLAGETLTLENRNDEKIMLQIRLVDGIDRNSLTSAQNANAAKYLESDHISHSHWSQGRVVLTQSGRLIADRIVRELMV